MTLHWLDPNDSSAAFPPAEQALREPNGLLAMGGDLSVERLLSAYRQGIFPWYNPGEPILWWSPDPRLVFIPAEFQVSSRLLRTVKRGDYAITLDYAFHSVITACAEPRATQHGTWISPEMIDAYLQLHQAGHAHSIEVWQQRRLVGGLYGVAIGHAFFGESMFSRVSNASKLALVWLTRQLTDWGFELLDGQVESPHLMSLGAKTWPRKQFLDRLKTAVDRPRNSGRWVVEIDLPSDPKHLPIEYAEGFHHNAPP